jgi:predicted MFS family arabinose efflux permease
MNSSELRSSLSLSGIFALRMLGLFLILPIFSLHAHGLPHGDNAALVGLTIGIYGMVQAFFHIPLGILSDKVGRRVIVISGLGLFVMGAIVAASHDDLYWILAGRAIQGAGAISAAITAWVADLTREEMRTRAMALIGGSIAISFAVSIVIASPLYESLGMPGIFWMMAILGILAIFVAWKIVPTAPLTPHPPTLGSPSHLERFMKVLKDPELLRLNIGVLILHTSQVAIFIAIPKMLVSQNLPLELHWRVYLSVLIASIVVMAPMLIKAEKNNRLALLLKVSVVLMLLAQTYFGVIIFGSYQNIWTICFGLFVFFIGFNLLESLQPSLVSRLAGDNRGAGLGIYNTTMSIGLFLGGALGGTIYGYFGTLGIFELDALLLLAWLIIAARMAELPPRVKLQKQI